ncbi:putative APSES transcription factor Xbp1 [Arthroderma uncinatum]|uniref:putative APSES transcription factor Xbp1 n=1 Tax=Arthroderma uncinatum TaxID=74035 RepID=UPI00144ACC30|nr:putative APSES transcription factor Xbp1 [Arthroderma uncinatum]KAF3482594.1 putative APSES transcription factor Xbp1 [Arthroderma uncinatum]
MTSIASLLNPEPDASQQNHKALMPCSEQNERGCQSPPLRQKKQKISKDAAVFTRGRVRGQLKYPPCEYQDEKLAEAHRTFEIHPMGHITEFPRHIPYNSEKKSFLEKTGRESFEVFQYEFKIPGDDKVYTVMWDYNIGLVRTTSLFRCNNYSKTAPAKMLNANPGLREICHSITGGALAAQGYWMPFEAAKAVAATFCWKIRYALTPLFGVGFLSECIPPSDEMFGRMIIDPAIVRSATITALQYRNMELEKSSSSRIPGSNVSYLPLKPRAEQQTNMKRLRPKGHSGRPDDEDVMEVDSRGQHQHQIPSYYRHQPYSPSMLPNSGWTPANTPRSTQAFRRSTTNSKGTILPSPKEIIASFSRLTNNQTMHYGSLRQSFDDVEESDDGDDDGEGTDESASEDDVENDRRAQWSKSNHTCESAVEAGIENEDDVPTRPDHNSLPCPPHQLLEGAGRETESGIGHSNIKESASLPEELGSESGKRAPEEKIEAEAKLESEGRQSPVPLTNDARAAYMLMKLHMQEAGGNNAATVDEDPARKRRRASA